MSFVNLDGAHAATNFKGPAFAQNSHGDNNQAARSFEAKLQEHTQQSSSKQNEQPNQNQTSHSGGWFDRGLGLLQAGAGVLEIVGGAAFGLATSETGVGAVAGGVVALHGIDDLQAGLRQAWSGKPIVTITQQAASGAAEKLGADPKLAIAVGIGVDLAAGGGVGGAEKAGVKALEEGGKLIQDGTKAAKDLAEASGLEKAASKTTQVEKYHATFGEALTNDYRATFFKANPELEGQVVVHHAVPQRTLTLYPDEVTTSKIHSLENLRGIPSELNSDVHLSRIAREWNKFYKWNPNATQAQLLDKATELDLKYGNKFKPPVGGGQQP